VDPSDLTHFRKRIGPKGAGTILSVSIGLHGKKAMEKEVLVDTTVQEKNITFPTDTKLHRKIIQKCVQIAEVEGVHLRRSYKRTVKKLIMSQRFRKHPKNRKKAIKASKQMKTIAGRLVRELERKLPNKQFEANSDKINLYKRILKQKRSDKNKVYSLHEPETACIGKGKEHKKYEFGSKASIALTKNSGIIVGALAFAGNPYDGHTIKEVLKQTNELRGSLPEAVICDRGYRGKSRVGETIVYTPKPPKKSATPYEKQKMRNRFRRRAGIEPIIGHLKQRFGLGRNHLKGLEGDHTHLMLSAAAFNFKKFMKALAFFFVQIFVRLLRTKPRLRLAFD
jgi:IS5 family transposase